MECLSHANHVYPLPLGTFQEWTFSRRILVFHAQTVSWHCKILSQQENGAKPDWHVTNNLLARETQELTWTSWPNLEAYLHVVERYNQRILGRQGDILNAFTAFTTVFGRTMKGDMLYGIPELFFHGAILFRLVEGLCAPQRRTDSDSVRLPSWSWVGWKGRVEFELTERFYDYLSGSDFHAGEKTSHFFVPEMYKIVVRDGRKRRERIKDLNYWRDRYPNKTTESTCLPKDWKFTSYVPLMHPPNKTPSNPHISILPHVELRTDRIFANLVTKCTEGFTMSDVVLGSDYAAEKPFFIQSINGAIIGYTDTQRKDVDATFLSKPLCTSRIELISIGGMDMGWEGYDRDGHCTIGWEFQHRYCPRVEPGHEHEGMYLSKCRADRRECLLASDWTFRFHNVLWIEWVGGVACRRSIGKVWAECWDGAGAEGIDVVLG